MPKRSNNTVQSIRADERRREKNKNKKARIEARSLEKIQHNPRAVRDELQRLRVLQQNDKLDAPGKEKLSQLRTINREFSLAKHAREEQLRKELASQQQRGGQPQQQQQQQQQRQQQQQQQRRTNSKPKNESQGPIIYRPGGFIPPPPPPRSGPGTQSKLKAPRQPPPQPPPPLQAKPTLPNQSHGPAPPSVAATSTTAQFQPPPPPPRVMSVVGCDGTTYQILQPGPPTGNVILQGSVATVHALGRLHDTGMKFWSTKDTGQQPFQTKFGVGNVIKGWDHGCVGMVVGEIRRLLVPAHEAYGSKGFPAWGIGPGVTLEFTLECLEADGSPVAVVETV